MDGPLPKESPPPGVGARILEAGAYTDIVSVTGPASVAPGQKVELTVSVKNKATYSIYISTTARYDNTEFDLRPGYTLTAAGKTVKFSGSFTMPNEDVTVRVWSFYWTGTEWYQDDDYQVSIKVAKPTFSNLSCSYRRA